MRAPPEGWPRITPAVFYEDAAAAIDWLVDAFGFAVQKRIANEEGRIVHSQLTLNGGLVMVGQAGLAGATTQALMVYGDDAVAHCVRARAAGAAITTEPATQDYGEDYWSDRSYEVRDLEGHHWWFVQRLRG